MFYKIIPKQSGEQQKSRFVWLDREPKGITLSLLEMEAGFISGIERPVKAELNDVEFKKYIEHDLIKVDEELNTLQTLKARLNSVKKYIK